MKPVDVKMAIMRYIHTYISMYIETYMIMVEM